MAKERKHDSNPTTKKPTGMSIKRDGQYFVCSWKIGDSNYKAGQLLWYKTNKMKKWKKVSIGTKTTKKTIKIDLNDYYPNKNKKLTYFKFRIQGRKESFKKKGHTIVPRWSQKNTKEFIIDTPNAISSLKFELSNEVNNSGNFIWESEHKDDSHRPFKKIQYQSMLVKECEERSGEKISWKNAVTGTSGANGSKVFTEDSGALAIEGYTRWFRIRTQGARGCSKWKYAKHVYSRPYPAVIKSASTVKTSNGRNITMTWESNDTVAHPIDIIIQQYTIAVPADNLQCPTNASWTDLATSKPKDGTDGAAVSIDTAVGKDQCLWVRVNTKHDNNISYSNSMLAEIGLLKEPTLNNVDVDTSTHKATVNATNNSEVSDSFLVVVYRSASVPWIIKVVGIIPHGQPSAVVSMDSIDPAGYDFGIYAAQGSYSIENETITISENMKSDIVWKGGKVPKIPTNIKLRHHAFKTIEVTWDWTDSNATGATISWSKNKDAWESTEAPNTFNVSTIHNSRWLITNVDVGKWYVRVRLNTGLGDNITPGAWSELAEIDLSEAPVTPVLTISNSIVSKYGKINASWSYGSKDGTGQAYGEICEATISSGGIEYGDIIATVHTVQSVEFDVPSTWIEGSTHYLCCRVTSSSGRTCDGWSSPVAISIEEPLEVSSMTTSLVQLQLQDEEGYKYNVQALDSLPLTVNVKGAGEGRTTVAIEREEDYHLARPDWDEHEGFKGETIALISQQGDTPIVIEFDDLIGSLDDGGKYKIIATIEDEYGQKATKSESFEVHWEHQAIVPKVSVEVEQENMIAKITVTLPEGAAETDKVDIYRLSRDEPELIIEDSNFGTTYVDPYPAFGENCGHRVVLKTAEGDYITKYNTPAWLDLDDLDGDIINEESVVINFGTQSVKLPYNITLSNSWAKDFERTSYLGGAVVGDWNPAVTRDTEIGTAVIVSSNLSDINLLRRLANYTDVCHVRTPEGSSYAADVQLSEKQSHDSAVAEFSLKVKAIDPEELDGMTIDEWKELVGG